MSSEPLERRSVFQMDREMQRLQRQEKKYKADNNRLRTELADKDKRITNLEADNREMRNFMLRLNSARIAMNNDSICKTLDDIDSWFRNAEKEAR